ncbi:MAG: putative sulfate exporter family transporter, partial [Deinococcales bacterium]
LGPLGIAMVLGVAWRATAGLGTATLPGTVFAARTLLRAGVVLLGIRLDFGLLVAAGPRVLVLDLLVVTLGMVAMERLGKALGLERGLRLGLAVGSCICGAAAIAAAAPMIRASDDDVSVSVGIVSLLGTLGVLGFAVLAPVLGLGIQRYGLMTGSTLHEVAQVLAAGAARGGAALDLATITKLTRVALLAPTLLVVGAILHRRDHVRGSHDAGRVGRRPPLLPGFLLGFLALGAMRSVGLVPVAWVSPVQSASTILMTVAMAAIGLAVDLKVVRRIGAPAIVLALAGFAVTLTIATLATSGLAG